jgi:uncharacterized protein
MVVKSPLIVLSVTVAFYALMAAAGILWATALEPPTFLGPSPDPVSLLVSIGAGALAAGGLVLLGEVMERRLPSLRALERDVRATFGALDLPRAALLALASAVGEELLFRGALLPATGIVFSSILFGFLHGFFRPRYLAWGLLAVAAGLVFGGLTLLTGDLVAAVVCHATVNYAGFVDLVPDD